MATAIAPLRLTPLPGRPPGCAQNRGETQPIITPLIAHPVPQAWPLHHRQSLRRGARVHGPASQLGMAARVAREVMSKLRTHNDQLTMGLR